MNEYRYLPGLLRVIGRDWLRGVQVHVDILVRTIYTYTYNLHVMLQSQSRPESSFCWLEPEPEPKLYGSSSGLTSFFFLN